jgi:hypothetical protein
MAASGDADGTLRLVCQDRYVVDHVLALTDDLLGNPRRQRADTVSE